MNGCFVPLLFIPLVLPDINGLLMTTALVLALTQTEVRTFRQMTRYRVNYELY